MQRKGIVQSDLIQRAIGWCEIVEGMLGTRLGAATQNILVGNV